MLCSSNSCNFIDELIYLIVFREFEKNYKNAEKDREALKKSTQAKFQKLSSKNQASDKLVCLFNIGLITCLSDFVDLLGSRIIGNCRKACEHEEGGKRACEADQLFGK